MNKQAFDIGAQVGFWQKVMPTDEEFTKSASAAGVDVDRLKQAYVEKIALHPLLLGGLGVGAGLLGGGLLGGGLGALRSFLPAYNRVWMSPYHRRLEEQREYNFALSRDAQLARAAYAPAPPPVPSA